MKNEKKEYKKTKQPRKKRGIVGTYQAATKGMQAVGQNFSKNEAQAMADFRSGKTPYNAANNPLKGSVGAFMGAFKAKRKLQRAMKGYKR